MWLSIVSLALVLFAALRTGLVGGAGTLSLLFVATGDSSGGYRGVAMVSVETPSERANTKFCSFRGFWGAALDFEINIADRLSCWRYATAP